MDAFGLQRATAAAASATSSRLFIPSTPEKGTAADKTLSELRLQLAREEELLSKSDVMSKLPDGGKRIMANAEELRKAIQKREALGEEADTRQGGWRGTQADDTMDVEESPQSGRRTTLRISKREAALTETAQHDARRVRQSTSCLLFAYICFL